MSTNKEIREYVGEKIKTFRCNKNITQKELAEYLNTTSQTISRYENGVLEANNDILFSLADYFKISINDFFPPIDGNSNGDSLNQYDILFSKYKDLNEEDKKFIATYIEEKKKQIDKEKNNE